MKIEIGGSIRNFVIFVGILVVMVPGVLALPAASPPAPSYITLPSEVTDVDGDNSEWDLSADFFANMTEAANSNNEVLSKLYLRYDCTNETLYALVLLVPDQVIDENSNPDNHYIKVNGDKKVDGTYGDDGNAPDFQFIVNATGAKIGWEASTPLSAGSYTNLNVHTQVYDDRTSAVEDRSISLVINCGDAYIPEFPTVALPIAAIIGLMFIFGRKRDL